MVSELSPARASELKLAEALAHVPGYTPGARVEALAGGAINKTLRVDTDAGRFTVRLHTAASVILGTDHIREAHLQKAAATAGVAPRVLYVDADQRFMISEYVDGRVWTAADFTDVAQVRRLGALFQRLHEVVPPVPAPFDLAALLKHFADRIANVAPAQQPVLARQMKRAAASLRDCGTETRASRLFHSDPHHSNIIESAHKLLLIDWEYAAIGDPLFDLACVLAYYPEAQPHAQELLSSSGLAEQATLPMLEHATWLYTLLNYYWDWLRRLGDPLSAGIPMPTPAD